MVVLVYTRYQRYSYLGKQSKVITNTSRIQLTVGLAQLRGAGKELAVITGKHICIVGGGAAGWIAYHSLKNHPAVSKITVVGSPTIPKIGVGESTTLSFYRWLHDDLGLSDEGIKKFLVDIDAAIKYGVNYEGWSHRNFLHHFNTKVPNLVQKRFKLGAKPKSVSHNQAVVPLADHIYDSKVYLSGDGEWLDQRLQMHSYHFDAGKFIQAAHDLAKHDHQLHYIADTVTDAVYNGELVDRILLESGAEVKADYYISCIGQTAFNQRVFREEYVSYSDYLLTTKALFCPLEYTDPVAQFHPYTAAKTMPHGWRWITPTRSRIGTGYVFSDNHISIDQAVDEFRADTGIPDLEPFVVDFWPRRVKRVFKPNMCTLGMASGFQEPLDAPGLSMTFSSLDMLKNYIGKMQGNNDSMLKMLNQIASGTFDFWCSFILHQYKTCHRSDTTFWQDHKQVSFDEYNLCISTLFDNPLFTTNGKLYYKDKKQSIKYESWMFYNTSSGRDIQWHTGCTFTEKNITRPMIDHSRLITHREYFDRMIQEVYENRNS